MNRAQGWSIGLLIGLAIWVCLVLLVVSAAGCDESVCSPAVWLMTGPDLDDQSNPVSGRGGIVNQDGIEFGLEVNYLEGAKNSQSYGAYVTQDVTVLPVGTQYIGARAAVIDVDETGNSYGFLTGEKIPIAPNVETVIEGQFNEYQDSLAEAMGTDDDWKLFAGLRVKF